MPREKKAKIELPKPEESLFEIRKLINIFATQTAIERISKIATTEKQKAIWTLCSGRFNRKQLALKSGAHLNTVKSFVQEAMTYGLLEEEKAKGGNPKRVVDYVPTEWKGYVNKAKRIEKKKVLQPPANVNGEKVKQDEQ